MFTLKDRVLKLEKSVDDLRYKVRERNARDRADAILRGGGIYCRDGYYITAPQESRDILDCPVLVVEHPMSGLRFEIGPNACDKLAVLCKKCREESNDPERLARRDANLSRYIRSK